MNKIYRFFGKRGRTTIPLPIRHALNMHTGDIISFSIKKGNVVITKEKICDNCGINNGIIELAEQMTDKECEQMLNYLIDRRKRRKGS